MSEKPGKRLVGRMEYLGTTFKKNLLNGSAMSMGCFGSAFLLLGGLGILIIVFYWMYQPFNMVPYIATGVYFSVGSVGIWIAKMLRAKAKKVPSVELLTQANARYLPEVETLVRPSDLPTSQQEGELLRATEYSTQTSPELLLRAAQGDKTDG